MIQKGDDLISGANLNYQYSLSDNQMAVNSGNLIQALSFEDFVPLESTLPPVETVLPHYIPTPPPSLPSPSVNITTLNTSVPQHQFQLQHQTLTPSIPPQHNQNKLSQYYYNSEQQQVQLQPQKYEQAQQQQHQQVGFHSSAPPFQYNNTHTNNNNNMPSTLNNQLFVEHNFSNNAATEVEKTLPFDTSICSQAPTKSHSMLSQETVFNPSDASTVDADETDNGNDEQFTYLQNLNSDNLMKFSQQSVFQQLIQEHVKPSLNLIPTCEEHDHGGYNFRIQINSGGKHFQRPGVIFSKETQRLYLKTNENVYIDCFYTQKMPIQQLRVRVFVVFDKDASDPVLRCQNHISKDNDSNEIVRRSLVRCKNPDAVYYGSDTGKSIKDRYSVVVPLNGAVKGNEINEMKQQLIISFTCFNSCMNRKQTAAIFLLEDMKGEILAQRTLHVKISTCPKRDRRLYECPATNSNKRKHFDEPNAVVSEAKMPKYDNTSIKDEYSRSSFEEAASDDGTIGTFSGSFHHERDTGDFVITLKYKNRQQMLQTLHTIYCSAVATEELNKNTTSGRRNAVRDRELLRKLYDSASMATE